MDLRHGFVRIVPLVREITRMLGVPDAEPS